MSARAKDGTVQEVSGQVGKTEREGAVRAVRSPRNELIRFDPIILFMCGGMMTCVTLIYWFLIARGDTPAALFMGFFIGSFILTLTALGLCFIMPSEG